MDEKLAVTCAVLKCQIFEFHPAPLLFKYITSIEETQSLNSPLSSSIQKKQSYNLDDYSGSTVDGENQSTQRIEDSQ